VKVLHGAVRLHGLASLPSPDTKVRWTCADALETIVKTRNDENRDAVIRKFIANLL
jgi:hypothetical protein